MATSSLYPPNSQSLSDGVISAVVQRAGTVRERIIPNSLRDTATINTHTAGLRPPLESSYPVDALTDRKRRHSTAAAAADNKPKRIRPTVSLDDFKKHEDLIKQLLSRQDLRRERCRTNQARYRKKQQNYLTELEATIERLKGEVGKLEQQRHIISFGVPTTETVWNIAAEYFRLFRHGYIAPMTVSEPDSGARPRQSHVQLEFLRSTMSIDVTDGTVRGVEAILENWQLFTQFHDDMHMHLERLEKGPGDSVLATMTMDIKITENTLRHAYPHLLAAESTTLVASLLNERLVVKGSIRFGWDHSSGRVMSLETKMDMLTPMLQLLGSLEDVSRVFEDARVAPDGKLATCRSA